MCERRSLWYMGLTLIGITLLCKAGWGQIRTLSTGFPSLRWCYVQPSHCRGCRADGTWAVPSRAVSSTWRGLLDAAPGIQFLMDFARWGKHGESVGRCWKPVGAWIALAEMCDLSCNILGAGMQRGACMGDTGALHQGGLSQWSCNGMGIVQSNASGIRSDGEREQSSSHASQRDAARGKTWYTLVIKKGIVTGASE